MVPDKHKSLSEGAIEPWNKPHYRSVLAQLRRFARRRGIPTDVPWSFLDEGHRRLVLEGDEEFTGILGFFRWLEGRKYRVQVRAFLARYRGYQGCTACGGSRLRPEALQVRLGGLSIRDVAALPVGAARRFLSGLTLSPGEAAIASRIVQRGGSPAVLPRGRGARLPEPRSRLGHPVGRRVAADRPRGRPRHGARRHALRPRRAVGGAAPPRHGPADRHPEGAARPGEHRGRGGARPGHPERRRPRDRPRAGSRRPGRASRLPGPGGRARGRAAEPDRQVPARRPPDPGPGSTASGQRPLPARARRVRAQPEGAWTLASRSGPSPS